TGRVRKKDTAFAEYAASRHQFVNEDGNLEEGPALKYWIASRDRVTVDELSWQPGQPQICSPLERAGGATKSFNSWRGLAPSTAPDDWKERVKPFLDHVAFLVPVEAEQRRFLQWLAHIVQKPQELPHTYYLMITETTGVGRNLLASIVTRVLRGDVAAGV